MKKMLASTAILSLAGLTSALAADIGSPPVVYPPVIEEPVYHAPEVHASSGWYLRGDAGYGWNRLRGITYSVSGGTNDFTTSKLKRSFSVGAGVGYQFNKRFRSDLTLDYITNTKFTGSTVGSCGVGNPCTSTDLASYTAWSLLANAYVDLFTYGRVTAYAGAGLGATYIDWGDLRNTSCLTATPTTCDPTITHAGAYGWRATAALMAGASIKITCGLAADVNYRYRYMAGGRMFGYSTGGGPGFTKAIHTHEGRAGLRYSFGGCADTYIPPYEPPTLPPVYK
ncbi:outer membrane protein [Lentilitoribacter sp. Alg239-R112]|uniref:outer membrane protein n=1 Tax=Lentilitoribacter sp. Alg239-R112 TaxID=2305987 RepID=UPI0013A6D422|nr:outer membrane protein [Lentilitoribacter sp. Alg239-R112]